MAEQESSDKGLRRGMAESPFLWGLIKFFADSRRRVLLIGSIPVGTPSLRDLIQQLDSQTTPLIVVLELCKSMINQKFNRIIKRAKIHE